MKPLGNKWMYLEPIQDGCRSQLTFKNIQKGLSFSHFTDILLQFGVLVAESPS